MARHAVIHGVGDQPDWSFLDGDDATATPASVASLVALPQSLATDGAVSHGIEIGATNTGPRVGVSASGVPGGVYTLDQAFLDTYNGGSATFNAKSFSGVEFQGATAGLAVSFVDCEFDGCAVQLIPNGVSNNGIFTYTHCYLYGTQDPINNLNDFSWSQFGFLNASNIVMERCDIEGFGAGTLHLGDNVTLTECYIHDPAPFQSEANGGPVGGTHHGLTTMQFGTCSDIVIQRCHYKAYRGTYPSEDWSGVSAALTLYNDSTHPGPIDVVDNYWAGGGVVNSYWGSLSGKEGAAATNITATGNIFGREIERFCGASWPVSSGDFTDPNNTWSNNTWGAQGPLWQSGDPAEGATLGAPSPT